MRRKKLAWLEGRTHLASPLKKRPKLWWSPLVWNFPHSWKSHYSQWRIQGRGTWGAAPLRLIFRPNWKQFFFETVPSPPYQKVWICRWLCMANLFLYFSLVCSAICHKSLNTKRNIEMQVSKFSCWLPPVFVLQVLFWSPGTVQC